MQFLKKCITSSFCSIFFLLFTSAIGFSQKSESQENTFDYNNDINDFVKVLKLSCYGIELNDVVIPEIKDLVYTKETTFSFYNYFDSISNFKERKTEEELLKIVEESNINQLIVDYLHAFRGDNVNTYTLSMYEEIDLIEITPNKDYQIILSNIHSGGQIDILGLYISKVKVEGKSEEVFKIVEIATPPLNRGLIERNMMNSFFYINKNPENIDNPLILKDKSISKEYKLISEFITRNYIDKQDVYEFYENNQFNHPPFQNYIFELYNMAVMESGSIEKIEQLLAQDQSVAQDNDLKRLKLINTYFTFPYFETEETAKKYNIKAYEQLEKLASKSEQPILYFQLFLMGVYNPFRDRWGEKEEKYLDKYLDTADMVIAQTYSVILESAAMHNNDKAISKYIKRLRNEWFQPKFSEIHQEYLKMLDTSNSPEYVTRIMQNPEYIAWQKESVK